MSTSQRPIEEGVYFIIAQAQQTCLQFTNLTDGPTLLTTASFTGWDDQKWEISPTAANSTYTYFIKNALFQTYISFSYNQEGLYDYVFESQTPYVWFAQNIENGIIFSPGFIDEYSWMVSTGNALNYNPITITYNVNHTNAVWTLNETTSIATTDHQKHGITTSDKIALGTGIGLGVPFLLLALFALYMGVRAMRRKSSNRWNYNQFDDAASAKRFELGKVSSQKI